MPEGYKHYYGLCEESGHPPIVISIEVHYDAGADAVIPDPDDWDDMGLRCPVCGNTVPGGYEGADDATHDEEKTKRVMAEVRLAKVQAYADQCGMLRMEPSTAGLHAALPPSTDEIRRIEKIPEAERTDAHRARLAEARS